MLVINNSWLAVDITISIIFEETLTAILKYIILSYSELFNGEFVKELCVFLHPREISCEIFLVNFAYYFII